MAMDDRTPVTFDLPDGDQVSLITWAYVVDKFNSILKEPLDLLESVNKDLTRIDEKLSQWVDNK